MPNELIYQSEFSGQQMDERFRAVATLAEALTVLEQAIAAKYTKPASGIPSTDMDADVQSALALALTSVQSLADYYNKSEVDQLLAAINGMDYVDVATLPTASASTMGKIYLVGPDASGYYSYYYTSYDGSAYSWVGPLGTTQISLANYATKEELSQLDQEVNGAHQTEEVTIPTTSGTAIPSQTRYDVSLVTGRTYSIHWDKGTSGITSQPFIYFYDANGTRLTDYTKNGNPSSTYEALSLNTDDVFVFQTAPAKVSIYVAGDNVPNTGYAKITISYNASGLVDIIADIALKANAAAAAIKSADVKASATHTKEKYVNYGTGALITAGASTAMEIYQVTLSGASVVRAYATAQDNVPAMIAFYSGTPSASTYMKDASIQSASPFNSPRWWEAPVPPGAKYVIISNKYSVLASPQIEFVTVTPLAPLSAEVNKKPNFAASPFWNRMFYSHFNPISLMVDGSGRKLIAGESLADVRVAARLGFDIIEANLHETSDGVIICTHGDDGFGPAFIDLTTGEQPVGAIPSFTYAYVLQNIRYNSDLDKYKTPPPTLDQFLECCKAHGIGAMVGVGVLSTQGAIDAIAKSRSVLNDRIIVYAGANANSQRKYFPGYFIRWFSGTGVTYQGIIDDMEAVGSPAICGLNDTAIATLKTAGKYYDLIDYLHGHGFLFSSAYLTEEQERAVIADGCDLLASSHEVNFFEGNGLAVDINDDVPQFSLTDATLQNGVISMQNGGTITIGTTDKVGLGKGMVRLRFDGGITVDFGSIGSRAISSDGTKDIVISDYFLVSKERVVITATSATTVYDLVYTTSRC